MVKIDVEGMESLVLAGAKRLIETCKPVIWRREQRPGDLRACKDAPGADYVGFWSDSSLLRRA
jgi:hypothetical protein